MDRPLEIISIISSMSWGEFSRGHGLHDNRKLYTQAAYDNTREDYYRYFRRMAASVKRCFPRSTSLTAWIIELDQPSLEETRQQILRTAADLGLAVHIGVIGFPVIRGLIEAILSDRRDVAHSFSDLHDLALMVALQNTDGPRVLYADLDVVFSTPGFDDVCWDLLMRNPGNAGCAYIEMKLLSGESCLSLPRALTYVVYLDLAKIRDRTKIDLATLHDFEALIRDAGHPFLKEVADSVQGHHLYFDVLSGLTAFLKYGIEDCDILPLNDFLPLRSLSTTDRLEVASSYFIHTRSYRGDYPLAHQVHE